MIDVISTGVVDVETIHSPIEEVQKIRFDHEQGSIWITGTAGQINAIRATLMKAVDYPRCILPVVPLRVELDTKSNVVQYQGYGNQDVIANTPVHCTYEPNPDELIFILSNFQFHLDPYIINTEDGVEYSEPYYFYAGKSHVRLHIKREFIDPIIAKLDERFPYLRFERYNAEVYEYIHTERR